METRNVVYFMLLSFILGWQANDVFLSKVPEPEVQKREFLACLRGSTETILHTLDSKNPMPECNFIK